MLKLCYTYITKRFIYPLKCKGLHLFMKNEFCKTNKKILCGVF